MLFNSLPFLLLLPVFLLVYFYSRGKTRHVVCVVGSSIFYGWWDWRFLILMFFVVWLNHYSTSRIAASAVESVRRRWLYLSVGLSLIILGIFKYSNFFVENVVAVMNALGVRSSLVWIDFILPIGISFYTFQAISYTIDVYRGRMQPEQSLLSFLVYLSFFPHVLAGPIVRANDFLPQLRVDHRLTWNNFVRGSTTMLWGYFLKCAVADSLAVVVDKRFDFPSRYSPLDLAISVLCYSFQIYGDFAGYSYIAIGMARIMGIDFGVNFNRPYFAADFSDFWQRWHISLSSWLKDYLYIPLGGNRRGQLMSYRNLMLTMLLGGLWHGASWNFVVWGGLHGIYLVLQRLGGLYVPHVLASAVLVRVLHVFRIAAVFVLVSFAWIFFRSQDLSTAWFILTRILDFQSYSFASVANSFNIIKCLFLIVFVYSVEAASFRIRSESFWDGSRSQWWLIPISVALLLMLSLFGTYGTNAFIYFQF